MGVLEGKLEQVSVYDEILKCANSKTPSERLTKRYHMTELRLEAAVSCGIVLVVHEGTVCIAH